MAVKDIGVRLVIENLQGFLSGMDQYNAKLKKAEASTQKFAERAGRAGRSLTLISAPLIALGALSVRSAISFETAFIGVEKTVDATAEQFAELEGAIRQMAQEIPASVEQLAALGETAGQLGIEVEAIEGFIRVVADLGVATNLSADQAAVSLARLVTITGLAQSEFGRLGSTLVDLGNNFAATEAEILTFGLRIASAAEIAGLAEAEILSIGAAMSAVGIQAQAGGTAVQRVLLNMTEAVATTNEKLAVFGRTAGLSAQAFADLFARDPGKAFTRFVEGLGTAGDDAFIILRELGLEDQRLLRSFLSLASAGDLLSRTMERGTTSFAENTALTVEAEKRYASAASQIKIAQGRFNEFFITVGASLVPILLKFLEILAPIISVLADLAGRFPLVTVAVVGLGFVIGTLGVGLLGLSFILPGLAFVVAAFGGTMTAAAVGAGLLAFALSPITLIVLGITAAVIAGILVWKNWQSIIEKVARDLTRVLGPLIRLSPIGGIGSLPQFGEGGTQRTTGPALVGERGPEVVTLPAGAQVAPVQTSTTFHVEAHYTNPQDPQTIRFDLEALAMATRA